MAVAVYQFGPFTLHCGRFELSHKSRRLRLERKPLELLVLLVTKHGQVVTREEIAGRLWEQEVFVDIEHGINTAIRKIRQTLGDSPDLPQFVQTISGSGYRFIATVTAVEPEVAEVSPTADVAIEVPPAALPELGGLSEVAAASGVAVPEAGGEYAASSAGKPSHRRWLAAGLCIFVLVIVALFALGRQPLAARLLHRDSRVAIGSIAVLPLQNFSGDPGQEYFADGMTDELITELARIPNLRVVSRTSVMADKSRSRPIPEIARELGVDAIVEGSIARSGDRIRITAQLIDARTDRHLWAQSFEGSGSDVLALQDSVAEQIASQASFVLSAPSPRAPINPSAHDAYLRGRYFFDKQDFGHSLESFKEATVLDPNYASAQAGYASALEAATTFAIGTPEQFMPLALAAARRAIQLDPQNGEAYTALGSFETIYEWNWNAAEQNLTRGISLNPSNPIAEFMYSDYLEAVGRPHDAVTQMRRALQLDPLSFLINLRLGVELYYDRQYDAALVQLKRAAEMEELNGSVDWYRGLAYEQKSSRDEAVESDLLATHKWQPQIDDAALLAVYRQHGWQAFWRAWDHALANKTPNACDFYRIGVVALREDEPDHAFASFQHALDGHCFYMTFVRVEPLLDPVRSDPRYAALLARMHP